MIRRMRASKALKRKMQLRRDNPRQAYLSEVQDDYRHLLWAEMALGGLAQWLDEEHGGSAEIHEWQVRVRGRPFNQGVS